MVCPEENKFMHPSPPTELPLDHYVIELNPRYLYSKKDREDGGTHCFEVQQDDAVVIDIRKYPDYVPNYFDTHEVEETEPINPINIPPIDEHGHHLIRCLRYDD